MQIPKLRIYVAAKLEEYKQAQLMMAKAKASGHETTYDWTIHVGLSEALKAGDPSVEKLKGTPWQGQKLIMAQNDLTGVINAEVLIFLYHANCKGAFVELGAALAYRKPVIVVKEGGLTKEDSVFLFLPGVRVVNSVAEALLELNELENKRTGVLKMLRDNMPKLQGTVDEQGVLREDAPDEGIGL